MASQIGYGTQIFIHDNREVRNGHSGDKYIRKIESVSPETIPGSFVDVYNVLVAFQVTCPAVAHTAKKLLCAGVRGKATYLQDLIEARAALDRAIQMASFVASETDKSTPQIKVSKDQHSDADKISRWEVHPSVGNKTDGENEGKVIGYHCRKKIGNTLSGEPYYQFTGFYYADLKTNDPSAKWCLHAAESHAKRKNKEEGLDG